MLAISTFSQLTGIGPKTLRFYHEKGLLVPAQVDQHTGYRWYSLEQHLRRITEERAGQDRALGRLQAPEQGRAHRREVPAVAVVWTTGSILGVEPERTGIDVVQEAATLGGQLTAHCRSRGWTTAGETWSALVAEDAAEPETFRHEVAVPLRCDPGGDEQDGPFQLRRHPAGQEVYVEVGEDRAEEAWRGPVAQLLSFEAEGLRPDPRTLRHVTRNGADELAARLAPVGGQR